MHAGILYRKRPAAFCKDYQRIFAQGKPQYAQTKARIRAADSHGKSPPREPYAGGESKMASRTTNVPESRQALDNMKFEIAKQLGINMTQGYNGNLTSRENGYVGGYMVKKMIEDYEKQAAGSNFQNTNW